MVLPSFFTVFYSLHPFTISKNKIGVANNIDFFEGKRAVVDNQRFNRGRNEGITRAKYYNWRAKYYKWQ